MKSILLVMEILTGSLFFATLVCGLWLRCSGEVFTEGNKNFHILPGLFSLLSALITVLLLSSR